MTALSSAVVLPTSDRPRVLRARTCVYLVFALSGLGFASLASRIPAIRDELAISPALVGIVLLAMSAGAVSGLPLSGWLVHRLGPARSVAVAATSVCAGLFGAAFAPGMPTLMVALFFVGLGAGIWDVAMNVEGAAVERLLAVAIMPRFHAAFSLGTVAGAGIGSLMAAVGVGIRWHLAAVAALTFVLVQAVGVRGFMPRELAELPPAKGEDDAPAAPSTTIGIGRAWREPRTLVIGLVVLSMAFAEGSANDWLALGVVDGYGASHAIGAAGFGLFVAAMTAVRFAGPQLLARFGRVAALRVSAVAVLVGIGLLNLGSMLADDGSGHGVGAGGHPHAGPVVLLLAAVGALVWGGGAALGFPVGMSAAADDPARAAVRVSVVSTIGYTAFLGGPPLLGLLGDHLGVVRALLAVLGAVLLGLLSAGATRPPAADTVER